MLAFIHHVALEIRERSQQVDGMLAAVTAFERVQMPELFAGRSVENEGTTVFGLGTRDRPARSRRGGLSGTSALLKRQIIWAPTLDKEDIRVTDQLDPHDQHDSELQLLLTIGIQGFRELVAWVAEGATAEDRQARGSQVRQVIDEVVKNTDSAKINQALLDEAERLSNEAPR